MAAVTPRTIGCCSTRPATAKSITPAVQRVYRTLSQGCFERLEPDIRKPICPVLRGGGDGNAAPLPDRQKKRFYRNRFSRCLKNLPILLANLLQSSRSTFSYLSFPSFFAFKEGMWETQILALLSSPTVSLPFLRLQWG